MNALTAKIRKGSTVRTLNGPFPAALVDALLLVPDRQERLALIDAMHGLHRRMCESSGVTPGLGEDKGALSVAMRTLLLWAESVKALESHDPLAISAKAALSSAVESFVAPVFPADGTVSPFTVINLGSGQVRMADSMHDGRLPALWFGVDGQGMGHEEVLNREAKPGETLAVVTFSNVEGLDVLLDVIQRIRREKFPEAAPRTAPLTWAQIEALVDSPTVDESMRGHLDDPTADSAVILARDILLAAGVPCEGYLPIADRVCKGPNCTSTNGSPHSPECLAEHDRQSGASDA